jgi:CheY-like chemotaxis protein
MAPRRVLVVDDSMEMGRMIQAALGTLRIPLQVTLVPSGEEAQLEFSRHAFDLVISDVRLPGISGLELTRRLRNRHKSVRIIQISGLLDSSLKQQAIDAGADYFFSKPLVMPAFLEIIEKLLSLKKTGPLPPLDQPLLSTPPVVQKTPTQPLAKVVPRHTYQTDRMSEYLSTFRQSLGAQGVALLDDHAHPIFMDGELLGQDIDPVFWPTLMKTLENGDKLAGFLGVRIPESVYIFKGKLYHLVVSPLGGTFVVLVVFRSSPSSIRLAVASDEILAARTELEKLLADLGVAVHPPQSGSTLLADNSLDASITQRPPGEKVKPTSPLSSGAAPAIEPAESGRVTGQPASGDASQNVLNQPQPQPATAPPDAAADDKLAADLDLLLSGAEGKPDLADANAFWDTLLEKDETKRPISPGTLTFEQASQMGLGPQDSTAAKK